MTTTDAQVERRIDRLDEQLALADALSELPPVAFEVIRASVTDQFDTFQPNSEAGYRWYRNVGHVLDAIHLVEQR